MIVLDASAVIELLLRSTRGEQVIEQIAASRSLHAPHVIDLEIVQVLRRYRASGSLSSQRAAEALEDLEDMGIHRYPHEPMLRRIWQLHENVTAYDAAYVALAEALGAALVTFDARLAHAPGHRARIRLLGRSP